MYFPLVMLCVFIENEPFNILQVKNECRIILKKNDSFAKKVNKNKQNLKRNKNSNLKPTRTMEDNGNVNQSTPPVGFTAN